MTFNAGGGDPNPNKKYLTASGPRDVSFQTKLKLINML